MMGRSVYILCLVLTLSVTAQDIPDYDITQEPDTTTTTMTTKTPNTTTTESTTAPITTSKPKTTTEPPAMNYFYNVTENNVTCIMLDGDLSFNITYDVGKNKSALTTVSVPKPSSASQVFGGCSHSKDQPEFIKISWGSEEKGNHVMLFFSGDEHKWHVENFTAEIFMDQKTFPNATKLGRIMKNVIYLDPSPYNIALNHSYKCYSELKVTNITTTIDEITLNNTVKLLMNGVQVQAFNKKPNYTKFVEATYCDADKASDIVPIAVGCALAALVLVVLIAYLVGRRRRSAAYQSV